MHYCIFCGIGNGHSFMCPINPHPLFNTLARKPGEVKLKQVKKKVTKKKRLSDSSSWSFIIGDDSLLIIRTRNEARARLVAQSYGLNGEEEGYFPQDFDYSIPNNSWYAMTSDYREYCEEKFGGVAGLFLEFNLEKLAEISEESDAVLILDEDGKNIAKEFLVEESKDMDKIYGDGPGWTPVDKEVNMKDRLIDNVKALGKAGMLGGKLAMAGRVNKAAYSKFKEMLLSKGVDESLFENQAFEAGVMTLLPVVMSMAAVAFEGQIPHIQHVQPLLQLSVTETVREHSDELLETASTLFQAMYQAYKQPEFTNRQRIQTDYEDLRTEKLKSLAQARNLGLRARISRDKLIAALRASDSQAEMEAEAAEEEETSREQMRV